MADVTTVGHGGTVQYSYNVSFTPSGVPADPTAASGASISVMDNVCGAATANESGGFNVGDTNPQNGNLDAGETWAYRCTFVVPAHAAGETDPIVNTVTVTGNDTNGDPAAAGMDTASVNIVHDAGSLSISKIADVSSVAHGGTVSYSFAVGYIPGADGSPAQNIVVTDPQCDSAPVFSGNGDTNGNGLLDAGEMWAFVCSFSVPALHSAAEEDPILNAATVNGQDLDGDPVTTGSSSTVSVNVTHTPGTLTVTKSADRTTVNHGQTVTYTFDVSYAPGADGSPAQTIVVTDPQCDTGTLTAPNTNTAVDPDNDADALLETGETWRYTCTFAVPATHSAGEEDPILNMATVAGQDLDGDAVTGDTSNEVSADLLHGGTISGRKFNDVNGNGSGTGDPGRNGVTITLFRDANGNGTLETATDTLVSSQQTATSGGQDGRYSFGDLVPATYFVQETVPSGSTQTAPAALGTYTVTIATDETVSDRDFGNFANITISGRKFLDLNNNGELDDDEPGLEDWQIFLDTDGDGLLDAGEQNTLTDEDGDYSFTNLGPGTYTVREILQAGWRRTSDNPAAITASSGQNVSGIDFGNLPLGDAMLVENPETGETDLLVTGTVEADRIFVRRGQPAGTVDVHINAAPTESFQPTGRIIVQSFEGDDVVGISRHIQLPTEIDVGDGNDVARGGSGDDILMGQDGDDRLRGRPGDDMLRAGDGEDHVRAGRGNDIVLGEDGDDHVRGAVGRDLLIGGEGADQLRGDGKNCDGERDDDGAGDGQKNQDIMIGGTTDHDDTDEALQAIIAEWTSARSYEDRVDNLRDGTGSADGENDDVFLDPMTVFDDDAIDRLHGCGGRDWFFALQDGDSSDQLPDRHGQEFVDELT